MENGPAGARRGRVRDEHGSHSEHGDHQDELATQRATQRHPGWSGCPSGGGEGVQARAGSPATPRPQRDQARQQPDLDQDRPPEGCVGEVGQRAEVGDGLDHAAGHEADHGGQRKVGETAHRSRQEARALVSRQSAGRAGQDQQHHGDASHPDRHADDVNEVGRNQQPRRVGGGCMSRERGGEAQEGEHTGQAGGTDRARGRRGRDAGGADDSGPKLGHPQPGKGRGEQPGENHPGQQSQSPDRAEAGGEHVTDHSGVERRPERASRCHRALTDDPQRRGRDAQGDGDPHQPARANGEALAGCEPALPRAGAGPQGRTPYHGHEHKATGRQREGEVGKPAYHTEPRLRHRPGTGCVDQLVQGLGRGHRPPNAEDETPGYGVRICGHHPEGRRVGAVTQSGGEPGLHGVGASLWVCGSATSTRSPRSS